MAKKILFLLLLVITLLFISFDAQSDVLIEDSRENAISTNSSNLDSGPIETGDGEEGNYVIIACANDFFNGTLFNAPTPLNWTQLDQGSCVGVQGPLCAHSIWGGFVSDPNSETITCTWGPPTVLFVSGSMRYTGVDPVDPIIDVACEAGQGAIATAPSIETEAGSQVLRVVTVGVPTQIDTVQGSNDLATRAEPVDDFAAVAVSVEFSRALLIEGTSELFPFSGSSGEYELGTSPPANWRACTIGIRMLAIERTVPTMSEWGLIGFAAFAGIAGVWYLRRRQAIA